MATQRTGEPGRSYVPRQVNVGARVLAPFALAMAAIVVVIVIVGSLDGSDDGGREGRRDRDRAAKVEPRPNQATYTVQPGDTLAGIAEDTGVPLTRIQQLNRDIDPQNLLSGQEIKLR